jgi:two-component system, sensor histidine kinase YesM
MNTIRFKLMSSVLLMFIPFVILLLYNDFFAINTVRENVAASNKNVVNLFLRQIDYTLDEMDKYLANLASNDTDLSIVESSQNENDTVLAIVRLKNQLSKDILVNKSIDAIFIYSKPTQLFLYEKSRVDYSKIFENPKSSIISYIDQHPNSELMGSEGWKVVEIGGSFSLLRVFKKGNTYVGAWVRVDQLLNQMKDFSLEGNSIPVFVSNKGEPMSFQQAILANDIDLSGEIKNYYLTGKELKFLIVGNHSTEGNFSMVTVTPDHTIFQGYPYIKGVLILIAVTTLLLIPMYLFIIRKTVLFPMNRILSVMKSIRKGNLDVRIEKFQTSKEYDLLNATFNDMLTQIKHLKIDIYEEKINRQKAELDRLHLQLKPHFYLNSLNIINSLARTKNYTLLQEMSLCLIEYFRYMFRSGTPFVYLKDELHHVKNYIRIQEMRFPQHLSYEISIPDFLLMTPVPPLIIQTFVENTVKHSVTLDEPIHLSINITLIENEASHFLNILIEDNGKGFSKEVLTRLEKEEPIIDQFGEHIGIRNVQQRMAILYKGSSKFICRNGENGGAVIELLIPAS